MSVVSETPTRPFATGPIPVKIVIAGGFGVGKTTFVGALSDIAPLTTEAAMTSPVPMQRRASSALVPRVLAGATGSVLGSPAPASPASVSPGSPSTSRPSPGSASDAAG